MIVTKLTAESSVGRVPRPAFPIRFAHDNQNSCPYFYSLIDKKFAPSRPALLTRDNPQASPTLTNFQDLRKTPISLLKELFNSVI
ncbi:hypothetical protein Lwal_3032 [Legionella waltersii]|uniref:Uncharacterized protein n=1 Tax=Legionella waltersii TaxID=66969 RepID=A0A0W1A0W8_9GAMM|nr:hypothetical protein Lwal_3032 [Legionella waltersii]SNV08253.1 Uncharacterised protein [Legionella waltersii]